jgi:hypothetical protein
MRQREESAPGPRGGDRELAAEVRKRVFAEAERFRDRLAELMPQYAGKWVVFRDGDVVSAHESDEEAYLQGLRRFGPDGGQVIAIVSEPEIVVLSALDIAGR